MAKADRIEWNNAEFIALAKSPKVMAILTDQARQIARRAGDGYEAEAGTRGKTRGRAWARAHTAKAIRDNAKNATLLRALGR